MKFHRHTVKHTAAVTILALLAAWAIFFLSVLVIQPGGVSETLHMFWQDKLLIPLNALPILAVLLICYWVIGNPFFAAGTAGLIVNLLSYVNLVKTDCRNDPFIPADIGLIREAVNAAGEYTLNLHWTMLAGLLVLSALWFLLGALLRMKHPKWPVRVIGALVVLGGFVWSVPTVYGSVELYNDRGGAMSKINVPEVFRLCGFPYCFLHNYNLYPIEKPQGYEKSQVEQWAEEDAAEYTQPEVQPNVIFIMCESYSDLSDEDVFAYETDEDNPMYGFHQLAASERARSGHIVVSNYGAGTANTEFDVLTGIQTNMVSPNNVSSFRVVHKSINALPWAYRGAGYATYFTHPGYSWFYNRDNVYRFLGVEERVFNDTYTDEDKKGTMISDEAFYAHLTADLDTRLGGAGETPLFAYGVTIQNHQAYPYSKYGFEPEKPPLNTAISDSAMETLSVYLEGIRDSTAMLEKLCDYFDSREEPVLLVFYGDHRPSLGQDYGVYRELGLTTGLTDTAEEILDTYKTPYLLWANKAYAPYCDFDALDLPETISSNYLGAVVYELTGMTGTDPYFDTLEELRRSLPVISHGVYVDGSGTVSTEATESQEEILRRLAWWKYYRLKDEPLHQSS